MAGIIRLILDFAERSPVDTQDRMPPIPEAEMTEAQAAAVADFKQTRNTPHVRGPFVPLRAVPSC